MTYKTKLIEVALPLDAISTAATKEKSTRKGNPSTLHLWWSRKPLAAARAILWASLVDDPSAHPELFPDEVAQEKKRKDLFKILKNLVKRENINNPKVLKEARDEILKSTKGHPPAFLDPFAGGGAIPLEAQRLGLHATASDLNPVAVLINKAMIEIPPKFAGNPSINPDAGKFDSDHNWQGTRGLASDVRYYGEWLLKKAEKELGALYPKIKDTNGKEYTASAYLWTRTVSCPNPACGVEAPLASSFILSKKKGSEAYVQPILEGKTYRYKVNKGTDAPASAKIGRGQFQCLACGSPIPLDYIRSEGKAGHIDTQMMAIVAEARGGKLFFAPNPEQIEVATKCQFPANTIDGVIPEKSKLQVNLGGYGFNHWQDLFNPRQLMALTTLSDLIGVAQKQIMTDGGTESYAQAIAVYLAFALDKLADRNSTFTRWSNVGCKIENTFSSQALAMIWNFAEANPFSSSSGSWGNALSYIIDCLEILPADPTNPGRAIQTDAQALPSEVHLVISTDPPYYDNISYSDLSDFFYVWLRHSLKDVYPELFFTLLTPKMTELIADRKRRNDAKQFFEDGMSQVLRCLDKMSTDTVPVTIYYAFKQKNGKTASTGWETMLTAIVKAGFTLTATWPIQTEIPHRVSQSKNNALTTSIVLVCRKRSADADTISWREFRDALRQKLPDDLKVLQNSDLAPTDLAQAAIGPGMEIYSRYHQILNADGTEVTVRDALAQIDQELGHYLNAGEGELDAESRLCIALYDQYGFKELKYENAEGLERSKNTSIDNLKKRKIVISEHRTVKLCARNELPLFAPKERCIWLITQKLTAAFDSQGDGIEGAAKILANVRTDDEVSAKNLTYRLYHLAEKRGWAQDASAYNSLHASWDRIKAQAKEIKQKQKQGEFFKTTH